MKKILSTLLLSATVLVSVPNMAIASSVTIDGAEIIKEEDSLSKAIRVKVILKDQEDIAEVRQALQQQEIMTQLKPHLDAGEITFQDLGSMFHLTVLRSVLGDGLDEINQLFDVDISKYLPRFDAAPSRSVLFQTPQDFNPHIYGLFNPDVKSAYNPSRDGTFDNFMRAHFFHFRYSENRPYKLPDDFTTANYLKLNPDVATEAYRQGDPNFFTIAHFVQHGIPEKRAYAPTLPGDFHAAEYFALNPDVESAAPKASWERPAFAQKHYLNNGFGEGRAYKAVVPQDFSPVGYLIRNSDVDQFITSKGILGLDAYSYARVHYMKHGVAEQRAYK